MRALHAPPPRARGHARCLSAGLLERHGLSLNDYEALHALLAETESGFMKRVELARSLGLTPSGITRLLEGLEVAGPRRARVVPQRPARDLRASDRGGRGRPRATPRRDHEERIGALFEEHLSAEEIEPSASSSPSSAPGVEFGVSHTARAGWPPCRPAAAPRCFGHATDAYLERRGAYGRVVTLERIAPGFMAPLHAHAADEAVQVLEGGSHRLRRRRRRHARSRRDLRRPRGVAHTYRVEPSAARIVFSTFAAVRLALRRLPARDRAGHGRSLRIDGGGRRRRPGRLAIAAENERLRASRDASRRRPKRPPAPPRLAE